MPNSSRRRLDLGVLFLAAMALSCSGKNSAPGGTPPPDVISGLQEEAIRQARAELLRGEELAQIGRWGEARSAFDRAVDLLLGIPGGVSSNEDAKLLYDDVLATTHEVERAYLAQTSDVAELSERAAVDELTEDVAEMVEGASTTPDPDLEDIAEATYDLPIVLNARVRSIIEMFQGRRHDWFQDALDRSGRYVPSFQEVFREEGLPEDLIYLAMVESAFKPRAVSRAGAPRDLAVHPRYGAPLRFEAGLLGGRSLRSGESDPRGRPPLEGSLRRFRRLVPRHGRVQFRPQEGRGARSVGREAATSGRWLRSATFPARPGAMYHSSSPPS